MNWKRAGAIVFAVALYWMLVYYRFHNTDYTPISFFAGGAILFLIGLHVLLVSKSVKFREIKWTYITLVIVYSISLTLILIAMWKHGLIKEIDVVSEWVARTFGIYFLYFGMAVIYPIFALMVAGTYKLLKKEHVFFWGMIILAWFVSMTKLLIHYVLK
jgi:hypothetical protein